MKTKPGFTLRDICGEYIIVAEGLENIDFSNIISLNESSFLTDEYEVDMKTAMADSEALAKQWLSVGVISE